MQIDSYIFLDYLLNSTSESWPDNVGPCSCILTSTFLFSYLNRSSPTVFFWSLRERRSRRTWLNWGGTIYSSIANRISLTLPLITHTPPSHNQLESKQIFTIFYSKICKDCKNINLHEIQLIIPVNYQNLLGYIGHFGNSSKINKIYWTSSFPRSTIIFSTKYSKLVI